MRLDSLERLINAADPVAFRELAIKYLALAGFRTVESKDGRRDGGNDISVWQLGANREPVSIQVSVQKKNWKSKLRADAVRSKEIFETTNFTYLSAHRIAGQDEQDLVTEVWSKHAIAIRIIDSQAIASKFYTENKTGTVLDTLGIRSKESAYGELGKPANPKEDLAFAYAFFGTDVAGFREASLDRSIAAIVAREQDPRPTREEVVAEVCKALGLASGRQPLVSGRIDHMLQRKELVVCESHIDLSPELAETNKTVRVLRGRQWRDLQDQIMDNLADAGLTGRKLERMTETVSQAAGGLMLKSALSTRAALEPGGETGPAKRQVEIDLQRVERQLVNTGLSPSAANQALTNVAKTISASEVGQTLLAGHLFLSLLEMSVDDLLQALGGRQSLDVFLDASVAIPMLAGLLYEPHDTRFFRAASHAYEQAHQYGVDLKLPRDYLEEAASHLLEAYIRYRPVLELGEDLRFSQNAFVAHYSSLRQGGKLEQSFLKYGEVFGLREGARSAPFRVERDWIMDRMRSQFNRYGIQVVDPKRVPREALISAEKAISFTARELGLDRSSRLYEHDARAIAEITSRAAVGDAAVMFCTRDRLHLQLSTAAGAVEWHAVDPTMLSDLLALASPDPGEQVGAALEIALGLGDAEARRGAEIWDELVKIEKENLYDAEALQRAREFKDGYLASLQAEEVDKPVDVAWEEWQQPGRIPAGD
jgi:hypothetical protein